MLVSEKFVTLWPTNDLIALTQNGSRGVGRSPHYLTSKTLRFSLTSKTAPGKPEVCLDLFHFHSLYTPVDSDHLHIHSLHHFF